MEGNSISKGKGLKSPFRPQKASMSVTSWRKTCAWGHQGQRGQVWRKAGWLQPGHRLLIPERRFCVILWAVSVSVALRACPMLTFLGKVRPGLWSPHSEEKRKGGQGADSLSFLR